MKIYGDANSGNCLKVKWVCDRLALPYTWVEIDTMKGGSRTAEFLKRNGWGQVPTVELDDGRTLAQSNAIIRYLARGSDLIPSDPYRAAQMDAWMFWEQNSHEPYVAVCRFQAVYLGKAISEIDPNLVKRGYVALDHLERHLAGTQFLVGDAFSLADVSLLAYTRVAEDGGLELARYPAIRRWIADAERVLALPPVRWPQVNAAMTEASSITIRRARREDVAAIVGMLADDPLGSARERIEDPLPQSYYEAFARVERDPNLQLVVAVDGEGVVVGCLQLAVLPGISSQGGSRGLLEDVRVAKHCRSRGIGEKLVQWAVTEARARGCMLVELLTHQTRVDAQRFYERLGFARSHVGMTIRF